MTQVNSFTFYFDYYNLIDTLSLKDKQILLVAITDYMFKDIEPDKLNKHNQAIFNTLKSQLNVSKKNSKIRVKKENQNETKTKPNENQNKTKEEPKKNKTSISNNIYNNTYLEGVIGGDEKKIIDLFQAKGIVYSNTPEEFNIMKYLTMVDETLIMYCIEDALIKNKGSINYIFGMIRNKIRNLEKRENQKLEEQMPIWFNQKQEIDQQGLEELEKVLEEI